MVDKSSDLSRAEGGIRLFAPAGEAKYAGQYKSLSDVVGVVKSPKTTHNAFSKTLLNDYILPLLSGKKDKSSENTSDEDAVIPIYDWFIDDTEIAAEGLDTEAAIIEWWKYEVIRFKNFGPETVWLKWLLKTIRDVKSGKSDVKTLTSNKVSVPSDEALKKVWLREGMMKIYTSGLLSDGSPDLFSTKILSTVFEVKKEVSPLKGSLLPYQAHKNANTPGFIILYYAIKHLSSMIIRDIDTLFLELLPFFLYSTGQQPPSSISWDSLILNVMSTINRFP